MRRLPVMPFLLSLLAFAAAPPAAIAEEPDDPIMVFVHPTVFKFVTTVHDDKKGDGGGWQDAKAEIPVADPRPASMPSWKCKIQVGMPIRTKELV